MVTKRLVKKETTEKLERAFGVKPEVRDGEIYMIVAELGWVYITINYTNAATDRADDFEWLVGVSKTDNEEDCDVVKVPDVDAAISAAHALCFAARANMRRR